MGQGGIARGSLTAAGGLAAVLLFLFRDVVFFGSFFYYRDLHLQWQPQVEAFVRSIAAGGWPVWNPYVSFGQPLWANPNNQVLYPLTWLNLILTPWRYYTVYVLAHFVLSGAGAYLLARKWGGSRAGAWLTAVAWVASGPFLSLVNLWNHFAGASWIPWIVRAGEATRMGGGPRAAALWAGALAAPILAGSLESTILGGLVSALLTFGQCSSWREGVRRGLTLLGVAGLAIVLSAAQWLPTLEVARRSARWSLPPDLRSFWSLSPLGLFQVLFPIFWAELPLQREVRQMLFESREPFLNSLYLGIASLPLVLAALLFRGGRRVWLLAALAAVAAAFALGRHAPFYELMVSVAPPLRVIRFPVKAMVLSAFAWAMLVGIGFEAWREGVTSRGRRWAHGLPVAAVGVFAFTAALLARYGAAGWGSIILAGEETSRSFTTLLRPTHLNLVGASVLAMAGIALVALRNGEAPRRERTAAAAAFLLCADLLAFHGHLNPTAPEELFRFRPPALNAVHPGDRGRVYVYDYFVDGKSERYLRHRTPYMMQMRREDWPVKWADALALRAVLFPSLAGLWGVETAYHRDPVGLYPNEMEALTQFLRAVEGSALHTFLLRMAGATRVVALHTQGFEDLTLLAKLPTLMVEPLYVYAVPDARPRTYAVGGSRIAPGGDAARVLADPGFDLGREVLLARGEDVPAPTAFQGAARIQAMRPDQVKVEAELSHPGWVVLLDAYDPGWMASVDGTPAEIVRANVAFRAVRVAAGRHLIEQSYRPPSIPAGLAISGVGLLVAGLLWRRGG